MSRSADRIISDFPVDRLWLFLIDGSRLERGPLCYENESGYLSSLIRTVLTLLPEVNKPLDNDSILKIHGLAMAHREIKGFRSVHDVTFGLSLGKTATVEGVAEINKNIDDMGSIKDYTLREMTMHGGYGEFSPAMSRDEFSKAVYDFIERRVTEILDEYEKGLLELASIGVKEEDAVLLLIIKMIQSMERLHPFEDGNCRTFCILVLLKELLRHDLSPTILTDPNCFDGFSISQMLAEIKIGQVRAEEIFKSPKDTGFFLSTMFQGRAVSLEDRKQWQFDSCAHTIKAITELESFNPYKTIWLTNVVKKINTLFSISSDAEIENLVRSMLKASWLSGEHPNKDFLDLMLEAGVVLKSEICTALGNIDDGEEMSVGGESDSPDSPDSPELSVTSVSHTPRPEH